MDLYDLAVTLPRRQQLIRLLNFQRLGSPLDDFAIETGQRWFDKSGGRQLSEDSKTTFNDYYHDSTPIPVVDEEQIERDLKRTSTTTFYQKSYKEFF